MILKNMSGTLLIVIAGSVIMVPGLIYMSHMAIHDMTIDRNVWNDDIKHSRIDKINNCDEFYSNGLGEKGYWVHRLYTTQQGKYFPDNQIMFDYIENKKMELGC